MTFADATTRHAETSRGGFLSRLLDDMSASTRRRRVFESTRHELLELSDRDLADIGVFRSDIDAVARKAAGMDSLK